MALSPCPDCEKPLSSEARSCPTCGYARPVPPLLWRPLRLAVGLTLLAVGIWGVAHFIPAHDPDSYARGLVTGTSPSVLGVAKTLATVAVDTAQGAWVWNRAALPAVWGTAFLCIVGGAALVLTSRRSIHRVAVCERCARERLVGPAFFAYRCLSCGSAQNYETRQYRRRVIPLTVILLGILAVLIAGSKGTARQQGGAGREAWR